MFRFILALAIAFSAAALSKALAAQGAALPSAYHELEAIESHDARFVDALVELQKKHYQTQDWQRFFGYAAFYRKQLSSSANVAGSSFRARLLSLEVMALAKHCLWNEAREIGTSALALGKSLKVKELGELEDALTHVELAHSFPAAIEGKADERRPAPVFSDALLWRLRPSAMERVSHPKVLRKIVASRCESHKEGGAK